jgi:hypothetical protein
MFGGAAEKRQPRPESDDDDSTEAFQVLVDAIVAEQAANRVRRDDPQALALYIWAMVHGVAMLTLDGLLPPPTTAEALAGLAIARLHDGIDR